MREARWGGYTSVIPFGPSSYYFVCVKGVIEKVKGLARGDKVPELGL